MKNRIKLVSVMLIWGSIGLFTRQIGLSPLVMAFFRAIIAFVFIGILSRGEGLKKIGFKGMIPFIVSGALIGFAWLFLFEGFARTSISTAVIVYNLCPVYVIVLSPFFLGEKVDAVRVITVILSFLGLSFIVGIPWNQEKSQLIGIAFSLLSGLNYAIIVIINRKNSSDSYVMTKTAIQMAAATLVLLPFQLASDQLSDLWQVTFYELLLLILLGVVHTGVAYYLYFTTYNKMRAVDIVTYSYLEPLFSILLSLVFLSEHMSELQVLGGVLILGATYFNEVRPISSLKQPS